MLFVFGALAFGYVAFAPGYVLLRLLRIESSLPPVSGPFALSLIVNHLLVLILVALGVYTQPVVVALSVLGLGLAAALLVRDDRLQISSAVAVALQVASDVVGQFTKRHYVTFGANALAMAAAIYTTIEIFAVFAPRVRSIFLEYDAVESWNRWAVDWAANHFPQKIFHYPQLLPTLWSFPYVAMGTSAIEYFSTSFKLLFWILSFETLVFLSFRLRNPLILAAVWATSFLFMWGIGHTSLDDMADVPIAFFALLATTPLIIATARRLDRREVWLALMLASGAAMTKQVGGYMLAVIPALIFLHENERLNAHAIVQTARRVMLPFLVALFCAAPMYIYARYTLANGTNVSELSYVLDTIFQGKTHYARAIEAWGDLLNRLNRFHGQTGYHTGHFIFAISLLSIANQWGRRLLILVCLPFTLLWAASFGYDGRNLALSVPFWGLCFALGVTSLAAGADRFATWLASNFAAGRTNTHPAVFGSIAIVNRYGFVAVLLMAIGFGLLISGKRNTEAHLVARQKILEKQELGGNPDINKQLFDTVASLSRPYSVISQWRFTCFFSWVKDAKACHIYFEAPEQYLPQTGRQWLEDRSIDWLVILAERSMTPPVNQFLNEEAFRQVAVGEGGERMLFFVRRKDNAISSSLSER
jgi:hypothetical protein